MNILCLWTTDCLDKGDIMNKRIRELAKEAGFSTWVLNPSKETMSDTPELLDKFAELIVKECMAMCDETQAVYSKHRLASLDFTDKNRYAAGEQAADTIYSKIKHHFGVE